MQSGDLVVAINLSVFFSMIAFVVWTVVTNWRRRQHLKNVIDFNTRLVDRIGSIKEFGDFLQTDGGAKFMDSMTVERGSLGPRHRVLHTTQAGVVVSCVGLALLFVSREPVFMAIDKDVSSMFRDDFWIAGIIVVAVGIGLLISAIVSYRVGKKLGVFDTNQPSL